jgi:hypothetical protein
MDGIMSVEYAYPNELSLGMTLRDYFAGQAMQGLLASYCPTITNSEMAQSAYRIADAMLEERAK